MECHKVERVRGAGENVKVEWPVTVTEECLMHPTRPARTAKATALNFGGYLDTTQFSDSHDHPLGRVKLVPGCRLDGQNILPNKFAFFGEVHPHAEGRHCGLDMSPNERSKVAGHR